MDNAGSYSNNALVDYSGFAKTINDLQGRFTLLQFLDFCSVVEGIILYDHLVMVGTQKLPEKWEPILKLLLENKVLVPEPKTSQPAKLEGRPQNSREGFDSRIGFSLEDAWYETGRLLGAEKEHHYPSLALLRQKPFYEKSGHVVEDHSVCNLFGKYQKLSETLEFIRRQTRLPLEPYMVVPIPPLPLLVLKRSNRPEEFISTALEVRDQYSSLRNSLKSLREDLADPNTLPLKKLKAINSWNKSWISLEKYSETTSLIEVALASNDLIDYADAISSIGLDTIKWTDLIERVLKEATNAFYKWRVRLLHKAANVYLKTSDGEINREVSRIFGREISTEDFERLKHYGIKVQ